MKKVFGIVLIAAMTVALFGCGGGKSESAEGGTLIVGTEAGIAPYEYMSGNEVVGVDMDAPGGALQCPRHSAVQVCWPERGLCDPGVGAGVGREQALGGAGVQGRAWGPFASNGHGRTLSISALPRAHRPGPRVVQGSSLPRGPITSWRHWPPRFPTPAPRSHLWAASTGVPRRAAVLPALRHRSLCDGRLVPWRFQ